jgi:hypothetical protein
MGRLHDRLARAKEENKERLERRRAARRYIVEVFTAVLDRQRTLKPWALEIFAMAASMHAEPWVCVWRECRKLLPKSRRQYLGQHHIPKRAAFQSWLAGEVVIPDGWKVGPQP